jgi:non-ribosomal peptide synthetase component F
MVSRCFHQVFEAAAATAPDAAAVEFGDTVVAYGELNRRANRLAHHLMARGVGPEVPVGVSVARSPDMVTAMFAIAKAGGAYVPLEPGEREERRAFVIEDSGLRTIIVDGKAQPARMPSGIAAIDLAAAIDSEVADRDREQNPGTDVGLRNLAYLIYTSGSTGQPKGTAMEHASLANLIAWHGSARRDSCGLRTLQVCSIGFDFSFHEIFSTLCFGGTLVMASEETRRDPFALARLIRERNVEKLFLPVSALLQWAAAVDEASFPHHLKHVLTTGEQLQLTPALKTIFATTGARLHNHYGATEFQDAAALTISGDAQQWPDFPSIGRPLANADAP